MNERFGAYASIYVCIRHYFVHVLLKIVVGILVHETKFYSAPSVLYTIWFT